MSPSFISTEVVFQWFFSLFAKSAPHIRLASSISYQSRLKKKFSGGAGTVGATALAAAGTVGATALAAAETVGATEDSDILKFYKFNT